MSAPDGRRERRSIQRNNTGFPELPIDVVHFGDYENLIRLDPRRMGRIKPTPTDKLIINKKYIVRDQPWNILTYKGVMAVPLVTMMDDRGWHAAYVFQSDDNGLWYGILKDFADQRGLYSLKSAVNFSILVPHIKKITQGNIIRKNANKAIEFKNNPLNTGPGSFIDFQSNPDLPYMQRMFKKHKNSSSYNRNDLEGEPGSKRRKTLEFGKSLQKFGKSLQKIKLNFNLKQLKNDLKRLTLIK